MHLIEGKLCARTDQCKARWDLFRVWLCKRTACTISMSRIVEGQQIDKQEGKQASKQATSSTLGDGDGEMHRETVQRQEIYSER